MADWANEDVEFLTRCWDTLSASQIGKEIGKTKSAVVGKGHRIGLGSKAPGLSTQGGGHRRRPQPPSVSAAFKPAAPPKPIPTPAVEKPLEPPVKTLRLHSGALVTLIDLGARQCKFPIGDPKVENFGFCGGRIKRGPYCDSHHEIAFEPSRPRAATRPLKKFSRFR